MNTHFSLPCVLLNFTVHDVLTNKGQNVPNSVWNSLWIFRNLTYGCKCDTIILYLNFLDSRSCWRSPAGPLWGPIAEGCFEGKGWEVQFLSACPVGLQWTEQWEEESWDWRQDGKYSLKTQTFLLQASLLHVNTGFHIIICS